MNISIILESVLLALYNLLPLPVQLPYVEAITDLFVIIYHFASFRALYR